MISEVDKLANIKSAKKRILVNETKAARNKAIKSKVKTCVKKVEAAVAKKDAATAEAALKVAISEINKAGSKGVYHKNTCARKIARLSKAVNGIA
jgi:small subunit ribosomal protein S20